MNLKLEPTYILPFMGIPMHLIMEDSAFSEIAFDIITECNKVPENEKDYQVLKEWKHKIAEDVVKRHVGEDMIADSKLCNDLIYILMEALDYDEIEVEQDVICVRVLVGDNHKLRVETTILHPKNNGGTL